MASNSLGISLRRLLRLENEDFAIRFTTLPLIATRNRSIAFYIPVSGSICDVRVYATASGPLDWEPPIPTLAQTLSNMKGSFPETETRIRCQ